MLEDQVQNFLREAHIGDYIRVEFEKGIFDRQNCMSEGYIVGLTPYRIGLGSDVLNENPDVEVPFRSIANYAFYKFGENRAITELRFNS